jgi:hypothetical protein
VQRLKITHNNGHEEIVTAERYRADGSWLIFEDADKQEVHRLEERDVRSIERADRSDVAGPMFA